MPRGPDVRGVMLLTAIVAGTALRLLPLRPYPGVELQELYPKNAIVAIGKHDWEPIWLPHGGGLLTVLRVLFTLWYAAGRVGGLYADRIDLVAAFARDPFPFILAGRLIVAGCALVTLYLVGRLASRLEGSDGGIAAAWLLAVTYMHVRLSHHVWLDVPAAAAAIVTVTLALRAIQRPEPSSALHVGAAGGLTLAAKLSTFPIAIPVVLAAWWGASVSRSLAARRLLAAAAAAFVVFVTFSPYTIVKFRESVAVLTALSGVLFGKPGETLSLATCLRYGVGDGILLLALVGLVGAARARPRETAIIAAFPLGFLFVLATGSVVYSRYIAMLAPFAALFAGIGAALAGRRLAPRHAGVATALLVALAGAGPARQSVEYVRLLAREDTRDLAGAWIRTHVPAGTAVTLPNLLVYPNPSLPLDGTQLQMRYPGLAPALRARGVADPRSSFPSQYLGFFNNHPKDWEPRAPIVVVAEHPVVCRDMNLPPEFLARLQAAGARPAVHFQGVREPLSPRVLYEPLEADYLPLDGADEVERPGPNLTIWTLPGAPTVGISTRTSPGPAADE